ncbi:uncharacterized protein EI97DRAFT_86742 [Westerdykella ornata]|uniref:Uncharacterized protein n=1 Tax=Westerdykella ornata TaxID=318751 RepID=A0A6A6JJL5_WESOR|nr:uncharacterized protein EI97DRAFT_86742 [Westerdykella ornata]KAF2275059.1 hypothetical protein EI97DRAFT_86742 [Westerdykella ornata]
MAPFRNRDRSNRLGRGQVEHNVLEGLPITQWREAETLVGPNPADEKQAENDSFFPELPMPRDSHLLPLHSQQILRIARMPRAVKPQVLQEEDGENMEEEQEPKEVQHGFTVKKYVKVPRHLEEPEPEYLAKRRKGLPSHYVADGGPVVAPPRRETKVKKVDQEGKVSVFKALVPEGQTIEGEILPEDTALAEAPPAAAEPGTVVEGIGVVNAEGVVVVNELALQTPPRPKMAPPKKKKTKPKGRPKKKVVFAEGAPEQETPASSSDLLSVPGVKLESGSAEPSEADTSMADAGEDEEGEQDSDDEGETRAASPTPTQAGTPVKPPPEEQDPEPAVVAAALPVQPSSPHSSTVPPAQEPSVTTSVETPDAEPAKRDPSSSPDLPLSAMAHSRQNSLNQIPTLQTLEPPPSATPPAQTVPAEVPNESSKPVASAAESASNPSTPQPEAVQPLAVSEPSTVAPAVEGVIGGTTSAGQHSQSLEAPQPVEGKPGPDDEPDLLGSLEAHLESEGPSSGDPGAVFS